MDLKIDIPPKTNEIMISELENHGYKYISILKESLYGIIAHVQLNGKDLAVKASYKDRIVPGYSYDDPLQECEYIGKIKHKNIIEYLSCLNTEIGSYIFMPFYPHGDLFDLLEKNYKFTSEEIYVIIKQIVDALIYLDHNNLTYMDVSLENIIIEKLGSAINPEEWKVRLIDLGSISEKETFFDHLKEQKTFPGKIQYRCPDIFVFMKTLVPFDIWNSYVYNLGVLLYILFVGYPPYYRPNFKDQWYEVIITGKWINPDFMAHLKKNSSHKLYLNVKKKDLILIDSCIKYSKNRITMDDFIKAL